MKRINLIVVTFLAMTAVASAAQAGVKSTNLEKSSMGFGIGIPYGVLGANFDINVAPNVNLSAGFGTTVLAGAGYNFGAKYFLASPANTFRPRVSAYYGVNSMISVESPYGLANNAKSFSGLTLGIGSQWLWGKSKANGMDLDVMFVATTSMNLDTYRNQGYMIEDPGRVKISVGYRRAF